MLKLRHFVLFTYFACGCESLYTTNFGIFLDEVNLNIFQSLTNSFINQSDQTTSSISVHFYNETDYLILDDVYITGDIPYTPSATVSNVLLDVQRDPSKALCHVAQWTNTSFVSLSSNLEESCSYSFYIQPTIQEYVQIALSLYLLSDSDHLEITILTNLFFALDTTVFVTNNDTLYSLRLYNWNSSSIDPNLYTSISDGTANRFIAIGPYKEIMDILLQANNTANLKRDQWIFAPTDSFQCPGNINMLSYVCILPSDLNNTKNLEVDTYIYDEYLTKIWKAVNVFVNNNLPPTESFSHYLETTVDASGTSIRLNIVKYNQTNGAVTESLIGTWTRENGLYTTENVFDKLSADTLTVVLINEPPFISQIQTASGAIMYEGYTMDILNEIAKRVGFKYTAYHVQDGEYGVLRPDGTWSGIIGDVAKGAADIGVGPISVTAERETVIDFSAPYYDFAGLQLLMRDPTVYNDMFAFASAFTGVVWITWFTIQISTAIILYVFHRLQLKTFSAKPQHNPFNFKECVWFVMGSITLAGADRSPITLSSRVLVAGFWFFCQIMMGTYTANLAAFMTSSRLSYSINSLDDLSSQTSITYSVMKGTVGETYFRRMANIESNFYELWKQMSYEADVNVANFAVWEYPLGEKYTKIWNAIQATGLIQNSAEGIDKVMNENFAYIQETPMIKYEMNRRCGLLTIGSAFSSKPYAFVLQQNSPFMDSISRTILQMQSETIMTELKDKWWKNETITCPTTEGNQGLSIQAVGGIFIVMAAGCGFSFLVLLMEVLWTKYKGMKNINKVKENGQKIEMKETLIHKNEMNESVIHDNKQELSVPRKSDGDDLSVVDLSKYGYI